MSTLLLHPDAATADFVDGLAQAFGRTLTAYQRECLSRALTDAVDALVADVLRTGPRNEAAT